MRSKPRQFVWWRRRELGLAPAGQGRFLSPERLRSLGIAVVVGIIAWTGYYWALGHHRIERLDEFARYLKGANLHREYDVTRITLDCESLRRQFADKHIAAHPDRMERDGTTLVFRQAGLDRAGFETWVNRARQQLAFGEVQTVQRDGVLMPALMVRLFGAFRFESGDHVETIDNAFDRKCRR